MVLLSAQRLLHGVLSNAAHHVQLLCWLLFKCYVINKDETEAAAGIFQSSAILSQDAESQSGSYAVDNV